jgi:uncharacterized protein with HEPN domain
MTPHSPRKETAFLNDMRDACAEIISRTNRRNLVDLASNGEFRDSVVLQLSYLGEAASHLSEETRRAYPTIAWRELVGLRNLLVHKYWAVDHLKIWEYAQTDVPALLETLSETRTKP